MFPLNRLGSVSLLLIPLLGAVNSLPVAAQAQLPETVYIWPMANNYEFPYTSPPAFSQNAMMSSLAGIVNRSTNGEVLLSNDSGNNPNPRYWLDQLKLSYPQVQSQVQNNPGFYIDKYRSKLSGYVLFDPAIPQSINVATSIAGVTDAIIVSDSKASGLLPKSTRDLATAKGLTQVADARNMSYAQAYAQYGSQFNKNMLFHQDTWFDFQLRDYAVMNRGFTYFSNPTALNPGPAPTESYAANQNPQGKIYGWANSEFELFNQASQSNQQVVGSNHNWSSSTTSRWKVPLLTQQKAPDPSGSIVTKPGKQYVAFVMSDGDNVTWLTNGMGADPKFFGNANRGKFNMNWDYTSSLAEMNPVAHNFFYSKANDGTTPGKPGTDTFVAAGGAGIMFPSQSSDIPGLAQSVAQSMESVDLRITSMLDHTYNVSSKLGPILDQEQIMGMMYKTYDKAYKGRNGAITWRNGKPIVSVKYSLWDKKIWNEQGVLVDHPDGASPQDIINALNNGTFDPIDTSGSYSIINVHPWSKQFADGTVPTDPNAAGGNPMDNVWQIVSALDPAKFEVVGLEELFVHLRNHFGRPLPGAVVNATWTRNASSDWGTQRTNWSGALPNFVNATVNFGSAITANRNVTVSAPMTAGTINFDNSFVYSIIGTNTLTLDTTAGDAAINVIQGSHTISAPLVLADNTRITVTPSSRTLTVSNLQPTAKSLSKAGAGTLLVNNVRAAALTVEAGTVRMSQSGTAAGVSKVGSVAVGAGAKLDLMSNQLIITDVEAGTWTESGYTGVNGLIQRGFNEGEWNGSGISTGMADALRGVTSLGVATADEIDYVGGTIAGLPIASGDVIVMYTFAGDANLDGRVDADDYSIIDVRYRTAGSSGWSQGDFNYDGMINADDYSLIDTNSRTRMGAFPTHFVPAFGSASALTTVPEPAAALLALALVPLLRTRRRARR